MGVKAGDVWERTGKNALRSQRIRGEHQLSFRPSGTKQKNDLPWRAPGEALSLGEIQAKRLRLCGILLMMDQELQRHNRNSSEVRIK